MTFRSINSEDVTNSVSSNSIAYQRQQLHQCLQQCRLRTLALFQKVDDATFCHQAHPDFSPVGWHLGHIAYTESLWLLERSAGIPPLFPEFRRLFVADGLPKSDRVNLPKQAEVCHYLDTVRDQVLTYLETADLDQQERLWRWIIQHESQHSETISFVLQLQESRERGAARSLSGAKDEMWFPPIGTLQEGGSLRSELRKRGSRNLELETLHATSVQKSGATSNLLFTPPDPQVYPSSSAPCSLLPAPSVEIPAGCFEQGNNSLDALDNERPVHQVHLETYWIDRYPVTCGQYRAFMAAGGYQNPSWWEAAGWEWLQNQMVTQPLHWSDDPCWDNHPVCGVSWYEAEAYARFVGKQLPTEAEWEKAASWDSSARCRRTYPWGEALPDAQWCNHDNAVSQTTPVDAYPSGQSAYGCYDMLGNVWEWTASVFQGYEGFASYPYAGYSKVYFDEQHLVLKGGSWATRPWALRSSFRNWYHPGVRQILAGFRCAHGGSSAKF